MLVDFKAYCDVKKERIPKEKRLELSQCACQLTDTPHGGKMEVVDKRIIVDALMFALPMRHSKIHQQPPTQAGFLSK